MPLERKLEPEVMDTPDEAKDYDAMDHTEVNRVFCFNFLTVWKGDNPILDVGTGTAQIPIELCKQDPRPVVTAIDLSQEMLNIAQRNIDKAGLTRRIQVERFDAKKSPLNHGFFAAVMSNSIIHHIPEPMDALVEMKRVCHSDGLIFVRDLMRPDNLDELNHLVATYAGDANEHQRQLFADSLHAALSLEEIRTMVRQLELPVSSVEATSDRHWTWVAQQ